jgi:two-component system, NarL family, sensor histidine kinase DesK
MLIAEGVGVEIGDAAFWPIPALGLLGPVAATTWSAFYLTLEYAVAIVGLYAAVRLVALAADLKATRADLARASVAAERQRVSGDAHDLLGQGLTALSVKADLARRLARADRARATAELDDLVRLACGQITELQAATSGCCPVAFESELADALALLDAAGASVDTKVHVGDLDPATSAVLGWVVREGTTNILRHANATRCALRATSIGDDISFELVNDSASGALGPPGTGLGSLANRVRDVRGALTTEHREDGSFHLTVTLPALVPASSASS